MNKMYTVILTIAALALMVPAQAADACYTTSEPTATVPDATGAAGGDIYVMNDFCQLDGCAFSLWIYQETNGISGLQRGDEVHSDVANCPEGGDVVADLDIF